MSAYRFYVKGRRARTARKGDRNEGRELSVGVVRPRFLRGCEFLAATKRPIYLNPVFAVERTVSPEIVPSIRIADSEPGHALIAPY